MERPKIATITVQWVDERGEEHVAKFSEATLEEAETLLSLMTGSLCKGAEDEESDDVVEVCPECGAKMAAKISGVCCAKCNYFECF